ncbi:MAG TPA: hypothetical protein VNX02_05460 [Steroidobacteraceae bacterium]|jgi:hypothetical protein|nr:hypothetical protein [Steroidobacteraceae bacterium]
MRHCWKRIAAAVLPVAATVGVAAPVVPRAISPVFHQLIAFSLPAPFKVAFEKTTDGFYIREHVPEGETVDEWSKMITLTGARGLSYNPGASPQAYLQALARGFQRHCPDTFVSLDLGPQPNLPQSFATVASCGRVSSGGKARSETSVMLAIKGSDDYYTLQWTEHGADSSHPLALDSRYWSSRLAALGPVQLCPIVPGEPPPYESCVGH